MLEVLKSNERLWELFTKKEEYEPHLLDQYQRFPYYLSKHRECLEPQVSAFLIQNGLKVVYPDNKKLINQMADLKQSYTAMQIIKIEAPSRGHDDMPDALALLCRHMMEEEGEQILIRSH